MRHCIIGANIMDRLVKCPGSLKPGYGSLADYDKKQSIHKHYAQTRIENNTASRDGEIVDDLAKSYIYEARTGQTKRLRYAKPEHECDPKYFGPAKKYADHILKVAKRFSSIFLDASYDMTKYIDDLPDCEFRVSMNPDIAIMNANRDGLAFISDLSTACTYDRNKMFQLLCCAVGLVEHYKNVDSVVCEVYNANIRADIVEVSYSKFSREELEAYRDDIIIPTLQNVRNALADNADNIEDYRHYNSWCDYYCRFKDEGCKTCKCKCQKVENEVPIKLNFFLDLKNDSYIKAYNNLFIND